MARVTGLEPATSGVTGRHSNQLSYTRLVPFAPCPAGTRWCLGGAAFRVNIKTCRPLKKYANFENRRSVKGRKTGPFGR